MYDFFDFNKSDLTSQGVGIADTAAKNAGPANATQLAVTGYTDSVGSYEYNMRLSRCRAYHGRYGFEAFSHARSVLSSSRRFSVNQLMALPYGPRRRKLLAWVLENERKAVKKRRHGKGVRRPDHTSPEASCDPRGSAG